MNPLEAIAAAIARGWARGTVEGITDALHKLNLAVEEAPNADDRARAVVFRDVVHGWVLRNPSGPGSVNTAPPVTPG